MLSLISFIWNKINLLQKLLPDLLGVSILTILRNFCFYLSIISKVQENIDFFCHLYFTLYLTLN